MKKYIALALSIVTLLCSVSTVFAKQNESHFSDGTQKFRYTGTYTEVTFKAPAAWYVNNTSVDDNTELYTFYPYGEGDESLSYSVGIWDGYYMSELSNDELLESYTNINAEISALENGKRIVYSEYKTEEGEPRIFTLIPEDTCYITVLCSADKKFPKKFLDDFTKITETIEAKEK